MNNRYARFAVAVLAVALVVVVVSWLYGGAGPGARTEEGPDRDEAPVDRRAPVARGPGGLGSGFAAAPGLRARTPAETVSRSAAIVRAKVKAVRERVDPRRPTSVADPDLVCQVTKVIYGRVPPGDLLVRDAGLAMTVGIDLRRELRREPTPAELKERLQVERKRRGYYEGEREVMIFLGRSRKTGDGIVWLPVGMSIDRPPKHALDDREKTILEVLRTGEHMTLTPGKTGDEALGSFLSVSREVVRARLKGIEGRSSRWLMVDLLGVVPGPVLRDPPTPEQQAEQRRAAQEQMGGEFGVDLELWHLRAEALARHQARQRGQETPSEKDIQSEFDRLLKAELKPGREAVLFLKSEGRAEGPATYPLVGIAHAGPDDPASQQAFEQFTQRVRKVIENREYLKQRFSLGL